MRSYKPYGTDQPRCMECHSGGPLSGREYLLGWTAEHERHFSQGRLVDDTAHPWVEHHPNDRRGRSYRGFVVRALVPERNLDLLVLHHIRDLRSVPDLGQISLRGVEKETNFLRRYQSPGNRCSRRLAQAVSGR